MQRSGTWYSYKDARIGQGRENAKQFLREHPDVAAELEARLRELLGLPQPGGVAVEEREEEEPS